MRITCLNLSCFQPIKMRYSIEPRDKIHMKGYGFLSFANDMSKSLSNKYNQNLLESAKKSTTGAIKNSIEISNSKNRWKAGDLIGNKIADKIRSISKNPAK